MQTTYDIAICGAGPVGQALALFLIRNGIAPQRIILVDAKTREQAAKDQRTIALSYGSRQFLQNAGAWPIKATEIHQIHVSRSGHFGRTLIDRETLNVPALGYVARYADIITPLSDALDKFLPALTFLRPAKVVGITQAQEQVTLHLEDQRSIHAQIVVQAEGGVFSEQASQSTHRDYQQSAVITTVRTSKPAAARAYERFTDHGPLALLPQEDGYALVWCTHPDQAASLLALDDAAFLNALQQAFGERVGKFNHCSARAAYALGLNAQTSAPAGRVICVGNAAQTLHPVAGQGLNLGLRDAYQLAQSLRLALTPASLQEFYQQRRTDRSRTIRLTDQLAQIFTNSTHENSQTTQSLLSAGLGALDIFPPAQHWLAEQMMFGTR
ncbi:2-octaprenyl-6-methoxyphenol hydroxylase [Oxalobacteraceae bacterium GrIS 1.18]